MTKIFDRNLQLFAKERPVEAMRIQMGAFKPLKYSTKENLKMPWGLLFEENSANEAKAWALEQPLNEIKVLYVYGVGLGAYYFPLEKWLNEDSERHLIFLEDDYAVLHRFFETLQATEILSDKQVSICHISSAKDSEGVLETLYWSSVMVPFAVSALKSYQTHKSAFFEELRYKLTYDTTMKNALVDEYLRYGAAFFRNFYPNMLRLEGSYWGNALFGKFKGIPAIICGAGPSLEKQINRLGTLKDNALIFAGGSSLNGLLAKDVLPHFGAGIDPNPTFLLRVDASQSAKVPFFFRTRIFAEAAKKIQGEKLYISGAGGYDIADYYEKKFGLEAEFLDEGHNVVNFCTEIAVRMGCNPIIFVGMDLAFTGKKAYTKGIDAHEDISEQVLLNAKDEEFRGLYRKDIYGNQIMTLWKWIAESDWLSRFAKEHADVTFINATEGGIGFTDIPNIPFQEVLLNESYGLEAKVQGEIQKTAMPQVTSEALHEATLELRSSLTRCIHLIDQLKEEIRKEKDNPSTTGVLVSGQSALIESDLYEEPAYVYILDIFHQVFARVQNKKITSLRLNKGDLDTQSLAIKKLEIQDEKLTFMRQVAEVNITIINLSITV